MRASSLSSSNSANATSLNKRLKTVFKKAYELSTLCGNEVCVIHYGPDGKLKTWPVEKEKVKDMAFRYVTATKRKKTLNLHEFLEEKKKNSKTTETKKKKKKRDLESMNRIKYPDWYPIFDHYSPNQLFQLVLSLEQTLSTLQERARFVEAQKQRNTNFVHQHHHQYQTQPLNPSQFSLYDGDATSSQLPLSSSPPNQLFNYHQHITNRDFQQPYFSNTQDYQNHLVEQNLHGFGQNGNFQHPCFSSTQDYQNHLMQQQNPHGFSQNLINRHFQKELYGGSHQMNMITNSNAPCLSNTVSDELGSDFQMNPYYGYVFGSTSSSQDFPELLPSYDESSLR